MKQIIFAFVCGLLFWGCNTNNLKNNDINSKLQRELNPDINETQLSKLIKGNNEFALSLYKKLAKEDKNLFFSPISITHALMMTYTGADGDTRSQMKEALRIKLDHTTVHKAFDKLDLSLDQRDEQYTFNIANSIWIEKDYEFKESYLDTIKVNYGASLKKLDFKHKPNQSKETINGWIEDKTDNEIKDLIPDGAITNLTKMVLTNAVYFKGEWKHTFDTDNSKKGLFNDTKEVIFMHQKEILPYFEDEDIQVVKLDYKSDKSSMIIILPKKGRTLELTDNYLQNIHDGFKDHRVILSIPKFKFTTNSISLKESLRELGMEFAFDDSRADFSKLSENRELHISDILHKAYINIDEFGTKAAAATAIMIGVTGYIVDIQEAYMSVDRPFIFLIVDNKTGQILFLGDMKEPK